MYIPTKTCWLKHWRTNTTANCWDDFHFSRCERWVTLLSHLNGIFTYSVLHLYQDIKFFKTSAALLVCTEGKIGDGDIVRCGYRTRQHVLHQMRNELWVVLLKFNHVSCVALTQRCAVKLKRNIQLIRPWNFLLPSRFYFAGNIIAIISNLKKIQKMSGNLITMRALKQCQSVLKNKGCWIIITISRGEIAM